MEPVELRRLVPRALAALGRRGANFAETDWVQIVEWYDELLRFADTPVVRLNRAVAIGEADGPLAGLAALDADVAGDVPRRSAVAAYLYEQAGDVTSAAELYSLAARRATSEAERRHLLLQAARLNGQR